MGYYTPGTPATKLTQARAELITAEFTTIEAAFNKLGSAAWLVTNSTPQEDIAVGSATTILWQTEILDKGGDFANNTFTAPVTGNYQINASLDLNNIDAAATQYIIRIVTSNRSHELKINPALFSGDGQFTFALNALCDMDAADTAHVTITQTGGSAQTDINTSLASYFSGFLIA